MLRKSSFCVAPAFAKSKYSTTWLNHNLQAGYNHPLLRELHGQRCVLRKSQLMFPIFITDEPDNLTPIPALPENYHIGLNRLEAYLKPLVEDGLKSVLLFGVPTKATKDDCGTPASDANGPVISAVQMLRRTFPDLYVACDVCMCAYTSHGHCGIPDHHSHINNATSVKRIAEIAMAYANAGAHMVAPSDMMDGRIGAIKKSLLDAGSFNVALMSYSAKFASSYYGPFRSACSTALQGDRKDYQLPTTSDQLAQRAILRDVAEGADVIMVKPGMPYLDIVRLAHSIASTPIAVYQVSGEYRMLYDAAERGGLDLKDAVIESMSCFRRAGADLVVSYFTPRLLKWLKE